MKLINKDALLEYVQELRIFDNAREQLAFCEKLEEIVEEQLTAYDIDKVIEQLKQESIITDDYKGNRAVEIIKGGGVE